MWWFFWKQSGKAACDVLPGQPLERTHDVWKENKYNPIDSGKWFTLPFFDGHSWALLSLSFTEDVVWC